MRACRPVALLVLGGAATILAFAPPPRAFAADQVHDEIQVYNAEIADIGQWTLEQHLNYAATGQRDSEIPGGFTSNHALQGTPEFAYGITDWWEAGFYIPLLPNPGSSCPTARQGPQPVRHSRRGQTQLLLRRQFRTRL